jgi:hypothetical protein
MRRVLVVDDEENVRLALTTLLKKNGYEVEVAGGGRDALELLGRFGPDFVLTDVRMPQMSGVDLLGEIKARGFDTTVIVMSAFGRVD